jgi:hypothetical protein
MEGASEEVLCAHLADIETLHMGLSGNCPGQLAAVQELLALGFKDPIAE